MESGTLLQIQQVSKRFGLTRALQNVTFTIGRGEVRGFIGENGSGKSTLSNIIAGVYPKDEGTILLEGEPLECANVVAAEKKGVALIVQEIGTVENITVAANLFLGNEERFCRGGLLDRREMSRAAGAALREIGVEDIDPAAQTGGLNLEERKIVEIAKAYSNQPRLLIVDETSNALSTHGRAILYDVIQKVKASGGTVLFITHDLEELLQVCDSVTILRDGVYIDTCVGAEMVVNELKVKMVGREISDHYYRTDWEGAKTDHAVLRVREVYTSVLKNVNLELHEGEILGVGGLSDCGMHELGRLLFGLDRPYFGTVVCGAGEGRLRSPVEAIQNNVGYISKNRDTEALVLQSSIKDNICLCNLEKISRLGFAFPKAEDTFADRWIEKLNIKLKSKRQYVSNLSGGNKQKVVLAKWLGRGSRILVMDCPTRGIDIGVKEAIYTLMRELKEQGHAIILISEELPELIGMSDRILIMKHGEVVSENPRSPGITEALLIRDMI